MIQVTARFALSARWQTDDICRALHTFVEAYHRFTKNWAYRSMICNTSHISSGTHPTTDNRHFGFDPLLPYKPSQTLNTCINDCYTLSKPRQSSLITHPQHLPSPYNASTTFSQFNLPMTTSGVWQKTNTHTKKWYCGCEIQHVYKAHLIDFSALFSRG